VEVFIAYTTDEGSREVAVENGSLTFGRGNDSDLRIADEGLSRVNSTIYREDERIWIIDENSTNGTFVNGERANANGTILKNGDVIKVGNFTKLKLKIETAQQIKQTQNAASKPQTAESSSKTFSLIAAAVTLFAVLVIGVSATVIGIKMFGTKAEVVQNNDDEDFPSMSNNDPDEDDNNKNSNDNSKPTPTKTPKTQSTQQVESNTSLTNSPEAKGNGTTQNFPTGKKYGEMSEPEKRGYIESRAKKVAQMIGNRDSGTIPPLAIDNIKRFLDGYAQRVRSSRTDTCAAIVYVRSDMTTVLERASKNASFIIHAFNSQGIDPQIGLYLAMIESEHCTCLQSGTGPLGMFQFTYLTGAAYFEPKDGIRKGSTPSNPDDRCKPEPAAHAAARYMKFLQGRYGTDPSSVPLAIGSYNSGEGGLSKNLTTALESNEGLPRDFWSLIANGDKLSKQFQAENFKYVPKFFAAAIIGENPQDFGVNLQPLSTYTK
jgi:pSer/pThr/pTyr-binding forkhead associated (FHA) protein